MMRWILGILVVANVAIFLWGQTFVRPGKVAESNLLPEFGSIRLVRESAMDSDEREAVEVQAVVEPSSPLPDTQIGNINLEPLEKLPEPEVAPSPEQVPAPSQLVESEPELEPEPESEPDLKTEPEPDLEAEPEIICGRIGPFGTEQATSDDREKLLASGLSAEISKSVEQVQRGYWVLIPQLPTRAEGKEVVARLREAGEKDIWLFNSGPLKNSISLGLYAGKNNAGRRSSQINKLGFTSEVRPKISDKTIFWLDYRGNSALVDGMALEKLSPGATVEKKSCN